MQAVFVSKETLKAILCHSGSYRVLHERKFHWFFRLSFRNATPWHSFNMKNPFTQIHPLGSAWCLLQTQYAKKPKNPV